MYSTNDYERLRKAQREAAEEIGQQPPPDARVLRYRAMHRKAPQGPPLLVLVNRGAAPAAVG
jgi:hypothetical protein